MLLSIIIPVYNVAPYVEKCLASLLCQGLAPSDYELIVVNDGSTDESYTIAKTFLEHQVSFSPFTFHLISQPNGGLSAARNTGIRHAKGKYIQFVDADDYWEPEYLATLVKLMDDYPQAGIWGMSYGELRGDKKYKVRSVMPLNFRGIIQNPWILGSPYWTGATAVSKSAAIKIGGFDNRIIFGEDIDLWYRLMLEYPCAFENTRLSYYRVDAENRACEHVFPLQIHLPYYIDKYADYRAKNADFRKFFDLMCLYRLYPYMFDKRYKKTAKQLSEKIDFSLQKKSMKLRFVFPELYRLYMKLKGRWDNHQYDIYQEH